MLLGHGSESLSSLLCSGAGQSPTKLVSPANVIRLLRILKEGLLSTKSCSIFENPCPLKTKALLLPGSNLITDVLFFIRSSVLQPILGSKHPL